jgi:hypothetical protein
MISNSLPGLDFDLGSDIDMLRDTVRAFAQGKDRAATPTRSIAATVFRASCGRSSARSGCSASPSKKNGAARDGLSRPLRRHGGDFARFGRDRPVLRRAFEPVRQSDPAQRQRRAEKALSAEADFRRACRRARHVGARRRLGRGLDAHARRPQAATVIAQRHENVDHQRALPTRSWSMPRPSRPPARAASPPSSSRRTLGFSTGQKLDKLGMRGSDTGELVFRIAKCRPRTCSASSATASTC